MLKYLVRWRWGWWVIHLVFIILMLWLGKSIHF